MSDQQFKIGLIIEGDGKGGIQAINATDDALKRLEKQTKETGRAQNDMGDSSGGLAGKAAALTGGLGAASLAVGALAAVIRADAITEIKSLADMLGMSAGTLTGWTYAASTVGLEADKMGDIFKDVQDKIGDFVATGGGEAKDLFDNLGLSIKDLKNLKPDDQLLKIAEGLEKVGTNGEKIFYLESLADDASRLLPLLKDGAEGLRKMMKEAELLGVKLSDVEVEQIAIASAEFKKLGSAAEGLGNQVALKFGGVFKLMSDGLMKWLGEAGGMGAVVDKAVNFAVKSLALLLDVFGVLQTHLKRVELVWLMMGEKVAEVMAMNADVVADFLNYSVGGLVRGLGYATKEMGSMASALGEQMGDLGGGLRDLGKTLNTVGDSAGRYTITAQGVRDAHVKIKETANTAKEELHALENAAPGQEFINAFENANKAIREQAETTVQAKNEQGAATKEATALTYEQTAAIKEQEKAVEKAAKEREKVDKEAEKAAQKAADAAEKAAQKYADEWEKAIDRMDTKFTDGWLDLIEGRSVNVFESITSGFKQMLAEMAHAAITKPIMMNFMQSFTGGPAGGGGVMGSGGGLGSLGGFSGGAGGYGGMVTSLGNMIGGTFGAGMAGGGGLVSAGNFGQIFSGAGSLFGAGQIGSGLGMLSSLAGPASMVFSLGSMLSKALGGDGTIGGLFGGLTGGLIGGKWKQTGSRIDLDVAGEEVSGSTVIEEKKKKAFKNRRRETKTDFDTRQVEEAFDQVRSLIEGSSSILGGIGNLAALDTFTAKTSIDTKDKTQEEVAAALDEWVNKSSDSMVSSVFGDALNTFQIEGETLAATLARVVGQLTTVTQGFDSVNISLTQLAGTNGLIQAQYAEDVLNAAGGSDRLNSLLAAYQGKFFTQQELLEKALLDMGAQMQAQLKGIGFNYGDDFRSVFEGKQTSGMKADELVKWLESASMIKQFDEIAAKLAEVAKLDVSKVIGEALQGSAGAAKAILDKLGKPEGTPEGTVKDGAPVDTPTTDPVQERLDGLNETLNTNLTENNVALNSIDSRLVDVKTSLDGGIAAFTTAVSNNMVDTDRAITAMASVVERVAAQVTALAVASQNTVSDLARVVGGRKDLINEPLPIFRPVELL